MIQEVHVFYGSSQRSRGGKGVGSSEYESRSVENYNCERRRHYARECQFKNNEGKFMVTMNENAPAEIPSEEEWDTMAAVAIQSMSDVEDIKDVGEPVEEEIDFESWFFKELVEELVEKETRVVSCVVADEEKP